MANSTAASAIFTPWAAKNSALRDRRERRTEFDQRVVLRSARGQRQDEEREGAAPARQRRGSRRGAGGGRGQATARRRRRRRPAETPYDPPSVAGRLDEGVTCRPGPMPSSYHDGARQMSRTSAAHRVGTARTTLASVTTWPVCREACSAAWNSSPSTVDGNWARPTARGSASDASARDGELGQRAIHGRAPAGQQRRRVGRRIARRRFGGENGQLLAGQPFAAGVGQQTVGAAGEVAQVKPDRRRAAGRTPERVGRQPGGRVLAVLDRQQERVRGRLEQRRNVGDGTAQPGLRDGHQPCLHATARRVGHCGRARPAAASGPRPSCHRAAPRAPARSISAERQVGRVLQGVTPRRSARSPTPTAASTRRRSSAPATSRGRPARHVDRLRRRFPAAQPRRRLRRSGCWCPFHSPDRRANRRRTRRRRRSSTRATPTNVVCAPPASEASIVFSHDAQAGKRCTSSVPEARCRLNESTTRRRSAERLPAPSQTTRGRAAPGAGSRTHPRWPCCRPSDGSPRNTAPPCPSHRHVSSPSTDRPRPSERPHTAATMPAR